jgi:hypothetical protein
MAFYRPEYALIAKLLFGEMMYWRLWFATNTATEYDDVLQSYNSKYGIQNEEI